MEIFTCHVSEYFFGDIPEFPENPKFTRQACLSSWDSYMVICVGCWMLSIHYKIRCLLCRSWICSNTHKLTSIWLLFSTTVWEMEKNNNSHTGLSLCCTADDTVYAQILCENHSWHLTFLDQGCSDIFCANARTTAEIFFASSGGRIKVWNLYNCRRLSLSWGWLSSAIMKNSYLVIKPSESLTFCSVSFKINKIKWMIGAVYTALKQLVVGVLHINPWSSSKTKSCCRKSMKYIWKYLHLQSTSRNADFMLVCSSRPSITGFFQTLPPHPHPHPIHSPAPICKTDFALKRLSNVKLFRRSGLFSQLWATEHIKQLFAHCLWQSLFGG